MTRTMHQPFAAGFEWGTITTPLVTLFVGGGGGGLLMAWLDRRSKREERQSQDRKELRHEDAAVAVKQAELESNEKAWYRTELREIEKKREQEAADLRTEMRQMRRTFGHELRNVQQYVTALQDLYHACFSALSMVAMQCRIMRARLKRQAEALGEKFDEDEFPIVDVTLYDPKGLPKFQPTNGWDDASIANEKKISGKVTITPDNP